MSTVIICLVLLAVVSAITTKIVRDKRKGKCVGCDCECDKKCKM